MRYAPTLLPPAPGAEPLGVRALVLEEPPGPGVPRPPVPTVAGIPRDLLEEGDRVRVDGTRGVVEVPDVPLAQVVTCFLERGDGKILLLRRSGAVSTFRGKWAAVSGYVETDPPLEQAYTEIREELGLPKDRLALCTIGNLVYARGEGRAFAVHPFHFRAVDPPIRIDREHVEYRWVPPSGIADLDTVPKLREAWERVAVDSRDRRGTPAAPRKR